MNFRKSKSLAFREPFISGTVDLATTTGRITDGRTEDDPLISNDSLTKRSFKGFLLNYKGGALLLAPLVLQGLLRLLPWPLARWLHWCSPTGSPIVRNYDLSNSVFQHLRLQAHISDFVISRHPSLG